MALGPLTFEWSQGPETILAGTTQTLTIDPPRDAFLHPSAIESASAVTVRVLEREPEGADQLVAGEHLLLLWRDGADQPPIGLTDADLPRLAPRGTTADAGDPSRNPLSRLQAAATSSGYATAHTNQADNGVDHF